MNPIAGDLNNESRHTERFEATLQKVDCPSWLKDGIIQPSKRQPRQSKRPRYQENRSSLQNYATLGSSAGGGGGGGGGSAAAAAAATAAARRSNSKEFSSSSSCYYRTSNWSTATLNDAASTNGGGGGAAAAGTGVGCSTGNVGAAIGPATVGTNLVTPNGSIDSSTSYCFPAASAPAPAPSTERLRWAKKPYLGWRSTDNLPAAATDSNNSSSSMRPSMVLVMTPHERLARHYHHPHLHQQRSASSSRISSLEGGNNDLHPHWSSSGRGSSTPPLREFPRFGVHDSIRSVTSAILDYCSNNDENNGASIEMRPKMVWKESSFLSSKHGTRV